MLGTSSPLLVAQDALGTAGVTTQAFRQLGLQQHLHTVSWSYGVQAGVVVIEGADREDYAGDSWVPLATFTFDGTTPAPKMEAILIQGPWGAIRHRIDQQIDGGTVTTKVTGQE